MTAGTGCDDCFMASTHLWPFYRAGCVGCGDRMLSVLKSLPVLDAPHPEQTCAGRNCGATDGPHSPECVADHMDCLFLEKK